jgi:hypothetical protein
MPERLTDAHGQPVGDRLNSLTAGPRGPILLQDTTLIDEITHFDRERIPERVVHAKGAGAFGYFETTHDISKYTKAVVFDKIGKKTPIVKLLFLRFNKKVEDKKKFFIKKRAFDFQLLEVKVAQLTQLEIQEDLLLNSIPKMVFGILLAIIHQYFSLGTQYWFALLIK